MKKRLITAVLAVSMCMTSISVFAQFSKTVSENDEVYNKILASQTFSIDDFNSISGGFGFIPVYKTDGISIDGNADDWEAWDKVALPTLSSDYFIMIDDGRKCDLTAECGFAYDENYFYVLAEVEDDIHYVTPGSLYWQTDCIQYAIADLDEGFGQEIGFLYDPSDNSLDLHGLSDGKISALAAAKRIGTKTIYEIAYPWDVKFEGVPKQFKFNMLVNDNDNNGRGYCVEFTPGISSSKDSSYFPVFQTMTDDDEWYGWVQSNEGTSLFTDNEYIFDYFVINTGDEEKKIKVTNSLNSDVAELNVKPNSGMHGQLKTAFEEAQNIRISVDFEDKKEKITSNLDLKIQWPTASVDEANNAIAVLENQARQLKEKISECNAKGISTQYENNRAYILKKFAEFMKDDLAHEDFDRVHYTSKTTTNIYNETMANLEAYLKGEKETLQAPVYLTSDIEHDGTIFYSDVRNPDGSITREPIILNGYHLVKDYAELKNYGAWFAQDEIQMSRAVVYENDGKNRTFTFNENSEHVKSVINHLEKAEKNDVWVDFLLGVHSFWDEVIDDYDIRMNEGVMIYYNINAPIAKKVVEDYVRTVMPMVAKYNCVKSITLTNEPNFQTRACGDFYNEAWWDFLRERYNNSIDELNASYGTSYTDFTQIDQFADQKTPAKNYDYETFNAGVLAEWHRWLADIVREYTDVPVATKVFHYTYDNITNMLRMGMNYELYADMFDINNNDGYNYINSEHPPLTKEMWYDYLQSVIEAPVIDTENHNIEDGKEDNFNNDTALHMAQDNYNGAVHGRVGIANWGLARNPDKTTLNRGHAPYRPDAMTYMSDTGLDMMRLAKEIKAIRDEDHEIGILYTNESVFNNDGSMQAAYQAYANSCYNGKTPRFVLESQLDKMERYPILIVPMMEYAKPETYEAVASYIKKGGKVLILGDNSLSKTDKNLTPDSQLRQYIFDNANIIDFHSSNGVTPKAEVENLKKTIRQMLKENNLLHVELIDTADGEAADGVDYSYGVLDGKLIVNICNYKDKPGADVEVKIVVDGKEVTTLVDLRKMEKSDGTVKVNAYDVTTVQVEIDNPFFDTYKHWGKSEIQSLYNKGLVKGVSSSRFNPDMQITRAEFLTMITRVLELPAVKYDNQILDVDKEAWYADTIAQGLEAKLIDNSPFRPDDAITREEMCTILIKAYEWKNGETEVNSELSFNDFEQIEDINAVGKAVGLGIMKGNTDGSFTPGNSATRAESSAVINRLIGII